MGTQHTRINKINWFRKTFQKFFSQEPKGCIDIDKLLAIFVKENSSTERTGKEILKMFDKLGEIKLENDVVKNGNF